MAQTPQDPRLEIIAKIPERTLQDVFEAIEDGAKNAGEALGFGPDVLAAIEQMAQAYYRTRDFGRAAVIFGFILQMNVEQASAWRGLGACAHAQKEYGLAAQCYRRAMAHDADDVPSRVFLGECLCQGGLIDEGVKILKEVIAKGTKDDAYKPYVTRARAVVAAGGGMPPSIVLKREGKLIAQEATELLAAQGGGEALGDDPEREIDWTDMKKNPELWKMIQELTQAVEEGRLTYAEVGGFTEDELDGAYAVACQYAEMGQVLKSIQIAGYLIFLDSYKGRYYQLVGICLQRMKQYEMADHYYRLALSLDKNDPMSLVYRGECKIMAGHVDQGVAIVREGVEAAKGRPELAAMAERGKILLKQFGT